jgi:hypothetical protein
LGAGSTSTFTLSRTISGRPSSMPPCAIRTALVFGGNGFAASTTTPAAAPPTWIASTPT